MAAISFYGNVHGAVLATYPSGINHSAGSGIGLYGAGYGISVPVGSYQDTTWVTNSNGTATDQYRLNNTKYSSISGTYYNGAGVEVSNRLMPNHYAPLKITFTHSSAVRVQNCKLKVFDRNDTAQHASGVTTQIYEIRHPNGSPTTSGLVHRGETDHGWKTFDPEEAMIEVDLTSSPGVSGLNTTVGETVPSSEAGFTSWATQEGAAHESIQHDWYIGISASPDSIGSKTDYAAHMSLEYL